MSELSATKLISKWLVENHVKHKIMPGEMADWIDIPVGWEENLISQRYPEYTIRVDFKNNMIELQIWEQHMYRAIGTADMADPDCFKLIQPLADKYGQS